MTMNKLSRVGFVCLLYTVCQTASAERAIVININAIDSSGAGRSIGTITATENPYGTVFTPKLHGLGGRGTLHAFHVHEIGDCGPREINGESVAGAGAGGHYDPAKTGRHSGPYGDGHLGDLPELYVDFAGNANTPIIAPRIKLDDIIGRSVMIHEGSDEHAHHGPGHTMGGGRMACGVIVSSE